MCVCVRTTDTGHLVACTQVSFSLFPPQTTFHSCLGGILTALKAAAWGHPVANKTLPLQNNVFKELPRFKSHCLAYGVSVWLTGGEDYAITALLPYEAHSRRGPVNECFRKTRANEETLTARALSASLLLRSETDWYYTLNGILLKLARESQPRCFSTNEILPHVL